MHDEEATPVGQTELTCREVVELVNDYLERTLSLGERARFERHLDDCPHCVTYLQQLRATVAATGRLREGDLDDGTREELLQAFRDWHRGGAPGPAAG
jgi:anti-sigma factor RsiW